MADVNFPRPGHAGSAIHDPFDFLLHEEIVKVLSELGIFMRNLPAGAGFANTLWRSWGYPDEMLTSGRWMEIVHPEDRETARRAMERRLEPRGDKEPIEYRIVTSTGQVRWVLNLGCVVTRDSHGNAKRYLGLDIDITDSKQTEIGLAAARIEAEKRAQETEVLRRAGAIVASSLDVQETIRLIMEQAEQVVPYDTASVQVLRNGYLEIVGGNGWRDINHVMKMRFPIPGDNPNSIVVETRQPVCIGDVSTRYEVFAAGETGEIRSWLGVPLIAHGEVTGMIALDSKKPDFFTYDHVRMASSFADQVAIALQNAHLYEETHRLAMTDSLTGLATRRSFFVQAERLLVHSIRYRHRLSVLMMDIDHFKRVNDEHGHLVGDDTLISVTRVIGATLRKTDVVGRYGGEEFVAFLPETGNQAALEIAERIRIQVAAQAVPGLPASPTLSIGVTELRPDTDSIDSLVERADEALYAAKHNGRNRCKVYL